MEKYKLEDNIENKKLELIELEKEKLFKDIFNGCTIDIDENSINYYKNNVWHAMFDTINNEVHLSYNSFWNKFAKEFEMTYYQVEDFLNKMIYKYFKIKSPVSNANVNLFYKIISVKENKN